MAASKDSRPAKDICKETMKQLAKQRTKHRPKVQTKVEKDWNEAGFEDLSEEQLVKGFRTAIKSGRTEPMWQVVVELTFLWCE